MNLGTAREQWRTDVGRSRVADAAFDELLARYQEPHRRYHGVPHVLRVVSDVGELMRAVAVPDPGAVRLAAWFHDAVYDPRSSSNEQDSADLSDRELDAIGVDAARRGEVVRLVLLTAAHTPCDESRDPAGAVLLDADLAVLGADPAVYAAYVNGVRSEYRHVDERSWQVGRASVLHGFLGRGRIYSTAAMATREQRARANLTAELATLPGAPP